MGLPVIRMSGMELTSRAAAGIYGCSCVGSWRLRADQEMVQGVMRQPRDKAVPA